MCGIFAALNYSGDVNAFRHRALNLSKRIRHRGPDWSGCVVSSNNIFCHERLAIMGVESGAQPIFSADKRFILAVNGEIYNYKELKTQVLSECTFTTFSDSEVILHLYKIFGAEKFVQHLDGIFSFVLYDVEENRYLVARDAIGVTTLYYGYHSSAPETYYFASEMKCLNDICDTIRSFPPGHLYDSKKRSFVRWYQPNWWDGTKVPTTPVDYTALRSTLERAVRKQLMTEVPFGVLLSGGLDSSLIASIAARETRKMLQNQLQNEQNSRTLKSPGDKNELSFPRLHSFSIGLPDKN